jgi:hypothetical protein
VGERQAVATPHVAEMLDLTPSRVRTMKERAEDITERKGLSIVRLKRDRGGICDISSQCGCCSWYTVAATIPYGRRRRSRHWLAQGGTSIA